MTEYQLKMKKCEIDLANGSNDTVEIPDDAIALQVEYKEAGNTNYYTKKAYIRYLEPIETD